MGRKPRIGGWAGGEDTCQKWLATAPLQRLYLLAFQLPHQCRACQRQEKNHSNAEFNGETLF